MKTLLPLLMIALSIFSAPVFAQNAKAEWTLMFYMDADNNLEAPQLNDLAEMMATGSTDDINIIVLCDRSAKGEPARGFTARAIGGLKNWTTAKLLAVEKGSLTELDDWGEVNMGDPATLKRFIQTVSTDFPANKYGLVFGDHGGGWTGIVADESADEDTLDTVELPRVFKEITAKTGKLELIGFDACLMGNFEAARSIAPYGKTMIASEELEPGSGWDYRAIFSKFAANPKMDGAALARIVVDAYKNFYLGADEGGRDHMTTLAMIDLTKIDALELAVSNLALRNQAWMNTGQANWQKTARARKQTEMYGGKDVLDFDLAHYAENIKREAPDAETARAADAVIAAVKTAVPYKMNGDGRPRSSGLSIYFPTTQETLLNTGYPASPFSISGKWMPFLAAYNKVAVTDKQAPAVENVTTSDANMAKSDVITVTAKVKPDDVAEASFVLAESNADGQIIIGALPTEPDEKGILREEWDGTWFSIGDGTKEMICPIFNFEEVEGTEETFIVEVPAQVRYKGERDWDDITLYFRIDFSKDEPEGEFIYAMESDGKRMNEVELIAGDAVRPVYLSVSNDGDVDEIASDDPAEILTIKDDDDLFVGEIDVAAGKYLIGFLITDYSENTRDEFTEVTVE